MIAPRLAAGRSRLHSGRVLFPAVPAFPNILRLLYHTWRWADRAPRYGMTRLGILPAFDVFCGQAEPAPRSRLHSGRVLFPAVPAFPNILRLLYHTWRWADRAPRYGMTRLGILPAFDVFCGQAEPAPRSRLHSGRVLFPAVPAFPNILRLLYHTWRWADRAPRYGTIRLGILPAFDVFCGYYTMKRTDCPRIFGCIQTQKIFCLPERFPVFVFWIKKRGRETIAPR